MRKLFLTAALWLMLGGAYAQDGSQTGQVYNRYGQNLRRSGEGWVVPNEDKIVARFGFDPATAEGWNEPWVYEPGRISPDDMKRYDFQTRIYKEYPGYDCKMDVYLPKGQGEGPFPFVLIIHGGGWTTGHEKTPNMVLIAEWFSSNGIACMSVSYTLSEQGTFENTKADLNDALKFIGDHSSEWRVDPSRFGFYGFSAGGHLSAYMAMTTPGTKMFISAAGPANMTLNAANYTREGAYGGNPRMASYWGVTADDTENLRKASPLFLIPQPGTAIPAALIIQGLMDMTVNPQQSVDFACELMKKGASTVEFMGLTHASHTTVNKRHHLFEDQITQLLFFAETHLK